MKLALVLGILLAFVDNATSAGDEFEHQPIVIVPPEITDASSGEIALARLQRSVRNTSYRKPADNAPTFLAEPANRPLVPVTPIRTFKAQPPAASSTINKAHAVSLVEVSDAGESHVKFPLTNAQYVTNAENVPMANGPIYALPNSPISYVRSPVRTAAYRPILPLAETANRPAAYVVGKGLLGQPKIFLPGQPLRNVLRYVSF